MEVAWTTLVQVLWVLGCVLALNSQVHLLFLPHLRSKPLHQISLVDLLNGDLALVYCANFTAAGATALGVLVSPDGLSFLPAAALSVALCFCTLCLLCYVSLGVVVQFAHVKLKTASIFDDGFAITDDDARKAIAAVTVTFSAATCATLLVAFGPGPSFAIFYTLRGMHETEASRFPKAGHIVVGLAAAAIVLNVTLRALITREKRRSGGSKHQSQQQKTSHGAYALMALGVVMLILGGILTKSIGEGVFHFSRMATLGTFCVLVPAAVVAGNDRLRQLAWTKFARTLCLEDPPCCKLNKVAPLPP